MNDFPQTPSKWIDLELEKKWVAIRDVRRVVTGHNDQGKAIFASDEVVEPTTLEMLPGAEWFTLWGGDEAPTFPDDGSMPDHTTYFPPLGGFRFGIFTVQPDTEDSMLPENFDSHFFIRFVNPTMSHVIVSPLRLSHFKCDIPFGSFETIAEF